MFNEIRRVLAVVVGTIACLVLGACIGAKIETGDVTRLWHPKAKIVFLAAPTPSPDPVPAKKTLIRIAEIRITPPSSPKVKRRRPRKEAAIPPRPAEETKPIELVFSGF